MKLTPWYLAAFFPIAVVGCSGMFLGHLAVLAVTLGIFFGTLSLGSAAALDASTPAATPVPLASLPLAGVSATAPLPRAELPRA